MEVNRSIGMCVVCPSPRGHVTVTYIPIDPALSEYLVFSRVEVRYLIPRISRVEVRYRYFFKSYEVRYLIPGIFSKSKKLAGGSDT